MLLQTGRLQRREKAMVMAAATVRHADETWNEATLFDFAALDAMPLARDPFDYVIVPGFLRAEALEAINRDFPPIEGPSNYAPERLTYGPAFAALLHALRGRRFAATSRSSSASTCPAARPRSASAGSARRPTATSIPTTSPSCSRSFVLQRGLAARGRPAAHGALRDRSRGLRGRGGSGRRRAARVPAHRPLVARPQAVRRRAAVLQLSYTKGGDTARLISGLTKPVRRLLGKS